MVIFLSLSLGRVLVDMTAGTVQPKPISMGTMLRPESPILLKSLSMKKATLAIYPLSSSMDIKKKRVTMMGRKLSTLPTPSNMPSRTSPLSTLLTSIESSSPDVSILRLSIRLSRIPCRKAPITLKVRKNTSPIMMMKKGMAVNFPRRILSILWLL